MKHRTTEIREEYMKRKQGGTLKQYEPTRVCHVAIFRINEMTQPLNR